MGIMKKLLGVLGLKGKSASIIFLGLANSGKTSIINHLKGEGNTTVVPTVGFTEERFVKKGVRVMAVNMSGQDRYQELWETYFSHVGAVIFVVDAADAEHMQAARAALARVLSSPDVARKPLLVLANKMDLGDALAAPEVATRLALSEISDRPWQVAASCALTGQGLEEAFAWLFDRLAKGR